MSELPFDFVRDSIQNSKGHGAVSFETLPREIRDEIYAFSLVALEPVVVWPRPKHLDHTSPTSCQEHMSCPVCCTKCLTYPKSDFHLTRPCVSAPESVQSLGLGLLLCNRRLGSEAVLFFYSKNTFCFNEQNWQLPLFVWLGQIGTENVKNLTKLETISHAPACGSWNGPVVPLGMPETTYSVFSPLTERTNPTVGPWLNLMLSENGVYDSINPLIESIFKLLGNEGKKLNFCIRMYPGSIVVGPLTSPDERSRLRRYGLDQQTLIEQWRTKHSAIYEGLYRVEVDWEGQISQDNFQKGRDVIAADGWKIMSAKQVTRTTQQCLSSTLPHVPDILQEIRFTLKANVLPLLWMDTQPEEQESMAPTASEYPRKRLCSWPFWKGLTW